jgi:hypothetical protein
MKESMAILVTNIYENMNNIFKEDDYIEPATINANEIDENFFTAELLALKLQFERLTQQSLDLIEFTHLLNKLAVQYLLENNAQFE